MTNASGGLPLNTTPVPSGAPKSLKTFRRMCRLAGWCALALLGANSAYAAPFAYVANYSDDTVSVIDTATAISTATITVGTSPLGVAINPAGTSAYVANFGSASVSVIDTATNAVTATVTVGNEPELLAMSPDGASVYVANLLDGTVSVVDTASNTESSKITVGGFPVGVAVSPAGDHVYVTEANLAKVAVIDTASKTVTTTIPVGVNPLGVVVNPAGTAAYVTNYGDDTVSVIDTANNTVVATVPVDIGPDGIAINPAGTVVYVVNYISNTVSVISAATNTVVAAVPVGYLPLGISIDSNGSYAYVSNSGEATVTVIDLSVNVVNGTTIATGLTPSFSAIARSSASVNLDQHGLTGTWYDPSTSGQGLAVEVFPDMHGAGQGVLSAGWFTFDVASTGGQRWYTLQGDVSNTDSLASLTIYASTGGNFNAAPSVSATAVGQATLQFTDCTHGLLNYTFTGGSSRSGSIPLLRLTGNTTCSAAGDNGAAASDYLLSGSWYNPSTSGQGLIFDINPAQSVLGAAWYTYSPTGQQTGGGASQRWYTIQSNQFAAGSSSATGVPIYETTGGVFHDPTAVTTTQVGTASITFQSCAAMTLAYNFTGGTNQGLNGTMNLVRVGPTPAGCSL
ncbi:MAG: beta-propeller fold lactonase family protein [Pseudolabrys sp.]